MAAKIDQRTHVGVRGPASFPVHKGHSSIPFGQSNDPTQHLNQLKFNINMPYSINSLASNFQKPKPLMIEKLPVESSAVVPVIPHGQGPISLPSSPASSISSDRLHFAVQLAKMDAKKLKEHREMEEYKQRKQRDTRLDVSQNRKERKDTVVHAVRELQNVRKKQNNLSKAPQQKLEDRNKKAKRNLHGFQFYPDALESVAAVPAVITSDEKQTREIRRLERQMHKYLEKLDEMIHKGQEVIQKKDKRLKKHHRDDISHLSDEDTDPRQFERAQEQATRSARVLYMIERQIRELDDELRRKGQNMRQPRKSQTLSRLAAAQRATVRALQMLINSAPLQPKGSQHYPSIYRELTSLIQQLSLLSTQLEGGELPISSARKPQNTRRDDFLKTNAYQGYKQKPRLFQEECEPKRPPAFTMQYEPADNVNTRLSLKNAADVKTKSRPDDSSLTIEPTPERSATLKAGLEALLRTKELEQKPRNPTFPPTNAKKKAVLLPPSLQAKRKRAQLAVQRSVKFPDEGAHFTKETTASRLKKVERQKTSTKEKIQGSERPGVTGADATKSGGTSLTTVPRDKVRFDENLQEKEIKRQVWLEDEAERRLREVMEIPKHLVSEAEEAIKMKLKPILDQAQAVVDSSKAKPIQERFAHMASNVTMKESDTLSDMILDDLLADTAEEFQRLENDGTAESQLAYLEDSSTLENILQRLEQFEKEEETVRRRLNHLSYSDVNETRHRPCLRQNEQQKSPESVNTDFEKGTREPHPIVFESKNTAAEEKDDLVVNKAKKLLPKFTKDRSGTSRHVERRDAASNMESKSVHYTKTSTLAGTLEKPAVTVFLPSKVRENIFSYREKYDRYLKQTNTQHHGTFDPWGVVERLGDKIFDEILEEIAVEFGGACDDVTELVFKSEFMKE